MNLAMNEREVFSEQEVTAIIQRAIAIQESGQTSGSDFTPGVTMDELSRIANEIGVSPIALQRALEESKKGRSKSAWPGFQATFERVLEGELNPNDFDVVTSNVSLLNTRNQQGVTQVGRTLTLHAWTGAGDAKVVISSRNARTKVSVTSGALLPIMMCAHPALITGIVTGGIVGGHGSPLVGVAIALGAAVLGILGSIKLLAANHRKSEDLADKVAKIVDDHLRESSSLTKNLAKATAPVVVTSPSVEVQNTDS